MGAREHCIDEKLVGYGAPTGLQIRGQDRGTSPFHLPMEVPHGRMILIIRKQKFTTPMRGKQNYSLKFKIQHYTCVARYFWNKNSMKSFMKMFLQEATVKCTSLKGRIRKGRWKCSHSWQTFVYHDQVFCRHLTIILQHKNMN